MSNKRIIQDELGTAPIGKLLWEYSLPAVVGTVVMSMYNIVDRMFIGLGVGPMAISGLGLTFPFMNVLIAFSMLVGVGAAARMSIYLGKKDYERAEHILGNTFTLTLIISTTVIILAYWLLEDILVLFGGSENTLSYAVEYMRIIIPGSLLSSLSFNFNNIMRASGFPRKAMITMFISSLINVALDALFIFGLDMGIAGAAHATNIAYFVTLIWVLSHFMGANTPIRFRQHYFKLKKRIVGSILSIGMSPFAMQVAASVVVILINISLIKHGGDLAVGALSIQNSIAIFIVMIIVGLNQGVQPIIGYNFGAGQQDRMFEALKKAMLVATIFSTFGFVMGLFFPSTIVGLFTNDPALKSLSVDALRISVLVFPLVGSQIVISNFFQSIGKAKISMFLSLTRQVLFLIPALMVLPPLFGLNGVWYAMPLSDSLSIIVSTTTFVLFLKQMKKQEGWERF